MFISSFRQANNSYQLKANFGNGVPEYRDPAVGAKIEAACAEMAASRAKASTKGSEEQQSAQANQAKHEQTAAELSRQARQS